MLYLWVKAFHIIFVVAWMAGMLIFPRYKLHQVKSQPGEPLFETMKEASVKLRRIIITPAMILVWVLGLLMIALNQSLLTQGWMHAKLALVFILSGFHGYLISLGRKVDAATGEVSARKLQILNELPFVIMIAVVILVIVKPF
ncbi:MAG: CopD family protein [Henriciella sp.]|nr:CopD family protein [Henriciella sp.]